MKNLIATLAVFYTTAALLSGCPKAHAQTGSTGYVSSAPPIYTDPQKQIANPWGTKEIVRCPEGFGLSFETDPYTGSAATLCRPIPANQQNGGAK